jgi:hypothetical protein
MQIGLSHLSEKRAWRIVSEDSGDRRPFLLIVRTLGLSLPPLSIDLDDEYQGILGVSSI